jgi:ribosomal protein L37AE/L43A
MKKMTLMKRQPAVQGHAPVCWECPSSLNLKRIDAGVELCFWCRVKEAWMQIFVKRIVI